MAFQAMYIVIHFKDNIRVFFEEISFVVKKMDEAYEMERSAFTIGCDTATDAVNITV